MEQISQTLALQEKLVRSETQIRADRLAVLIDADNARASLIEPLLKEITKYGTANVKRIYGDWTKPQLNNWKEKLNEFVIQPIQQFGYTTGKNSTDSALIIDAMDLLYTQNFDGFCIISSDSDFTRLASRIRESGLFVYGFGEKKTPLPFVKACDRFIYTEILEVEERIVSRLVTELVGVEENKLSTSLQANSISLSTVQAMKNKKELVKLIKSAYEAVAEEDGWANLGPVGAQLTKLSPSFDSRNYGYKKLGELIRTVDFFEIKETPHEKNPSAKELQIKLKSAH